MVVVVLLQNLVLSRQHPESHLQELPPLSVRRQSLLAVVLAVLVALALVMLLLLLLVLVDAETAKRLSPPPDLARRPARPRSRSSSASRTRSCFTSWTGRASRLARTAAGARVALGVERRRREAPDQRLTLEAVVAMSVLVSVGLLLLRVVSVLPMVDRRLHASTHRRERQHQLRRCRRRQRLTRSA